MYYVDKMFEYYIIFCFAAIAFQLIEKYFIPEGKYKPSFIDVHSLLFLISIVWITVIIISWIVCIPVVLWFFRGQGYIRSISIKGIIDILVFIGHFICTMTYRNKGDNDEKED